MVKNRVKVTESDLGRGLKGRIRGVTKPVTFCIVCNEGQSCATLPLPCNCPNQSLRSLKLARSNKHLTVWKKTVPQHMMVSALMACLAACSMAKNHAVDETQTLSPRVIRVGDPVPKGGGAYKLGQPYFAAGKWYTPVADATYDRVGMASWYGDFFHGRKTANGEIYDMNALSAAHTTFPMPSYAKVTNLANNRSIIVRVNDRGPYASNRIIDVSHKAALLLDFHRRGTTQVRVQYWGPAPLNGDDTYERKALSKQPWVTRVENTRPSKSSSSSAMLASAMTLSPPPSPKPGASTTEIAKTSPSNVTTVFPTGLTIAPQNSGLAKQVGFSEE